MDSCLVMVGCGMEVGCLDTAVIAPWTILYCSAPEPAGGDGCGVSGVAGKHKNFNINKNDEK